MKKRNPARSLLTEIALVLFFFAIASMAVARLYSAAQRQSQRADLEIRALTEAQNIADQVYAVQDAEALLLRLGFEKSGEGYARGQDELKFIVTLENTDTGFGILRDAEVTVRAGEDTILTLPCARYLQGVGT